MHNSESEVEPFEDSGSEYQPSSSSSATNASCENDGMLSTPSPRKKIKENENRETLSDFYVIEDTDIKKDKIATCLLCKNEGKHGVTIKMKNRNTSGLKRHLQAKHSASFKRIFPNESSAKSSVSKILTSSIPPSDASTSHQGKRQLTLAGMFENAGKKDTHFQQSEFENLLINFVVTKYLPFNFFEDESSKQLFSYLNKNVVLPQRNTLRHKILKKFNDMQEIVKNLLTKNNGKISCTIDSWTSIRNNSYYGVTCYFIDNSWKIQSFALDFIPSEGNHDGKYMAKLFYKVLKDYNIVEKLQGVTTDNASVNFSFLSHLKVIIGPNFDHENRHFICFSHVLNLAVQDLMKIINVGYYQSADESDSTDEDECSSTSSDEDPFDNPELQENAVTKTRILLKKIKKSEQQQNKFKTCCDTVNLKSSSPVIDVKTRWNSTFEMLSWAVKYKVPLNILCDTNENLCRWKHDEQTWCLIERIVKYLRPFKTLSDRLGGDKYSTLSMVVVGINLLLDKLETWAFELNDKDNRSESDETIVKALIAARDKILKHYKKSNWIYCVALILDPRHKKETFSLTNWGKELEETAIKQFEQIYQDNYFGDKSDDDSNVTMEQDTSNICNDDDLDFSQIFFNQSKHETASFTTGWRQEIDDYFSIKRADENTNILDWWSKHEYMYPNLSKMAKDILSTTATSVPSERLFSKASLIIRKHRNRLNPESSRCLLCLNSWKDIKE